MGIFVAWAVWVRRLRWLVLSACAAVFLAATIIAGFTFFQPCDEEDAVWAMQDTYRSGTGFEGEDEYTPPYADSSLVSMDLPTACLTSSATTVLGQPQDDNDRDWSPEQHSCDATFSATPVQLKPDEHIRVQGIAPHAGYLILRLRNSPAWTVALNGQVLHALTEREDGLIAVPLAQGPFVVAAEWTTSTATIAGRWISLLALLLILALSFIEKRSLSRQLK